MKIDTKKCLPIQFGSTSLSKEESMIHPNKYIPADTPIPATTKNKDQVVPVVTPDEEGGRKIMYQAQIIYTPILTSERQHKNASEKDARRRLVSEEDMDELNKKLEDLFVKVKDDDDVDDGNSICDSDCDDDDEYVPEVEEEEDVSTDDDSETCNVGSLVDEDRELVASNTSSPATGLLGRIFTTVLSYKTCEKDQVCRSARILDQELGEVKPVM